MMVLIVISDCDETATRTEVFFVSRSLGFEKSFIYQTFHFRIFSPNHLFSSCCFTFEEHSGRSDEEMSELGILSVEV